MRKTVYSLGTVIFYLVVHHKHRVLIVKTFFHLGYYYIKGIKMLRILCSKLFDEATWIAIVIHPTIKMVISRAICNSKILPCMKVSYPFHSLR